MDHQQFATSLDLEGDLLRPYIAAAVAELRRVAGDQPRRNILDIGAGTGSATIELAQRFAGSAVTAVDAAPEHLERLRQKALELGLAERITTVEADLDAGWPALPPADVAWAAMSLHHLTDPDRALRALFAAIRPGGLLAVMEMGDPLWLFVDGAELGRPGLMARSHDAFLAAHAEAMPGLGHAWAPRLRGAGFTVMDEHEVPMEIGPPYPPALAPYARELVERLAAGAAHRLDEDDQAALQDLAAGDELPALLARGAVVLRGSRIVTLARRPAE